MAFTLRPLEQGDFTRGFLESLANLSPVDLTPAEAIQIWRGRNAAGVRTVVAVEPDGAILGTGSLILEHKFLHHGGTIGHIEDVAVLSGPRGQGRRIGRRPWSTACHSGCYKVILSCNDQISRFLIPRSASAATTTACGSTPGVGQALA